MSRICPNVQAEQVRLALQRHNLELVIAPWAAKLLPVAFAFLKRWHSDNAEIEVDTPLGQLIHWFVFERALPNCDPWVRTFGVFVFWNGMLLVLPAHMWSFFLTEDAFVAFAEEEYGEDTGNPASTFYELQWWVSWMADWCS
jgi:hypothetical protein